MFSSLIFVTVFHLAVKAQQPACLITAPNIVHLGVEETVSVQLHGADRDVSVILYFNHRDQALSEKKTVVLNVQNQYQAVVKLRVDPDLYKPKSTYGRTQHIQLAAESPGIFKGKRAVNIILSTRKGYLFIQTDKSIYNPGEMVNYRIFTLNNYMLPVNDLVQVQIFNCKDMLVYSSVLISEQILQKSVSIPDIELPGRWKITASFHNYQKSNTSVQFEVREYVLPSFEVKIEAPKLFLTLNSLSFQFSVSARYTYMKEVDGVAYIRYGLIDSNGNRTYLPGTEQQTTVKNGHADINVLISDLRSAAANQSLEDLEGLNLYIAASVLEKASGDLEEAEISSVKIVNSPYVIDLSKTKQYFTPGGKFSILATTTFPHGSRVPNLKINATIIIGPDNIMLTKESQGDSMGNVIITLDVPAEAKNLFITVHAEGNDGEVIISDAKMKATAIEDVDGSYLSLEVQHQILQPGQNLHVTFRDIMPPESVRPSHIYYLVVSKGQILQASSVHRTDLTSIDIPFSPDMVPSFRLVAYYYTKNSKLVADSLWVDVKDVCKGKVEVSSFKELQPAQPFEVSIKTDAGSKVALSAVDSAVFILNNRDKISPQRMFDYMNSYDLACSVGGGKDALSVLQSAGLTYISTSVESPIVKDHRCYENHHRQKRDISALVNKYKQPERKCCEDGRKLGLMQQSCDERLKRTSHQTSSCREAFRKCCEAATIQRRKVLLQRRRTSLGRSSAFGDVEEMIDESSIQLRSYFPQSWMWLILEADVNGNIRKNMIAPDSITTWEVQTVSISQSKGFCIADPVPLKVFQDFFISLKLPYSVKRNEQLQVKVILYNYKQQSLQVTVKMEKVEGLCSAGGGDVVQEVSVESHSALSVYFTVIPLIIGNIPISVLAYASNSINDKIKKELKVVGEGEIVSIHTDHNIDAKSEKKLELDITLPDDALPGQDSTTMMSFRGGVMGESADNCLNLEGVNDLIKLPKGCAEQTMVKMSPAIHAMHYLDATNQWISLKAERRDEAKEMIQAGYNRVLTYKKDDGSYGAFLTTPSSNWLTAFIAKELTESKDIIKVNEQYIQKAMTYLISKQKANGAWDDPNPLYDQGMKGGVGKVDDEDDVPLTAFILLSMKNAMKMYLSGTDTELRAAMEKARSYLVQRLSSLRSPYAMALTAYALSLNTHHTAEAIQAHQKLMDMATCDDKQCFWNVSGKVMSAQKQADAVSVEATAYGLLQAVTMQDKSKARRVASWLTEQRKFGGGFQSTQDTVVALEALSKFGIQNNDVENLDLTVDICINDGDTKTVQINKRNALTQAAIQVKDMNKVTLDVRGEGRGTVSIVQNYRSLKKDESACDHFFLSVTLEGELKPFSTDEEAEQLDDDYYNYGYEDGHVMGDAPDKMHWFDLRTRRKRTAPEQSFRENTLVYTVCVGVTNGNSSGMVLVDLSLLSGLTPKIQDLEDNVKGTERYIDHYDVYQNKVYLYFHKISFGENACLRFRAEQIVPIGLVQPAAAVIYDYYRPDRRCSVFYTVADGPMLFKLCEEDVCVCAEGGCPKLKVTFSKNMEENTRTRYACFSPSVDFVYTIKILNISNDNVFKSYTTIITQVLQPGKDTAVQEGAVREMLHRSSCEEVNLSVETEYLIMGQDESIYEVTAHGRCRYMLDNKIWIEEIPPQKKCKATKSKAACQRLSNFLLQHSLNQCSI